MFKKGLLIVLLVGIVNCYRIQSTTQKQAGHVRLHVPLNNVTRNTNDNLRLRCEITGNPIPKYQWFKDDQVLKPKDRVYIKITPWGSRLYIKNLKSEDSGMYGCRAMNKFGNASTTGYVQVGNEQAPNNNYDYPDPSLYRDGLPGNSYLDVLKRIETGEPSNERTEQPFCQLFKGSACSTHIVNKTIYVTSRFAQGIREELVIAALSVIANSIDLSDNCRKYAIPSICHYSFPQCDRFAPPGEHMKKRQICRDECEMLEETLCKNEYIVANEHPLIDNSVLPKCDQLPKYGSPCIRVGVPVEGYNDKCYKGNGHSYRGQHSKTKTGKVCANWNHNSEFPIDKPAFSDILGDHNQCRNPNGTMAGPWCYNDSDFRYKELCDVPVCAKPCGENEFTCDDGQCIPEQNKCNEFPDCTDDSDEKGCNKDVFLVGKALMDTLYVIVVDSL